MLSKIVSLSLAALAAGQVQIEGSPEWQAYKNAELAWISPSVGPTPVNFAQAQLNHIAPAPGPTPVNYAQSVLNHQAAALNFVAGGRKKRQVSVVGSPEWQAWKQAELNFIAPSVGPTPNNNFAQAQLNHLADAAAYVASGAGRKKRQVSVVGSPEWQAWKQAELNFIAPSVGPTPNNNFAQAQLNHLANAAAYVASGAGRKKRQVSVVGSPEWQAWKQAELNFIAPSVGPTPNNNFAQAQLNHLADAAAYVASGAGRKKRQVQVEGSPEWQAYKNAELAFIAPSVGPTPLNYAQSELNFIAPSPGPTPINYAQSQLNFQQEALNFIARSG